MKIPLKKGKKRPTQSINYFLIEFHPLQEAVEMVKPFEDPEQASKKLLQEAYQRGSADNITCVVVRFLGSTDETTSKL